LADIDGGRSMSDNFGYMEYDFSRLNKIKKLEPKDARDNFLRHYQIMKQYKSKCILQFTVLNKVLIHEKISFDKQ